MSTYSITLWDSLKFEILNVQEEDLAQEALSSLQAIATRFSHGLAATDPNTHLARYLRPITEECTQHLQEPEHKQAKTAGEILSFLGTASPIAFFLIIKAVMPPLMTIYQASPNIAAQRSLLEVLTGLFNTAIIVQELPGIGPSEAFERQPLDPFHDRLFDITSQALMGTAKDEISLRITALKALLRLCSLNHFLSDGEVGLAVQYFDEIVLDELHHSDYLRNEAIQALVDISKLKPHHIMNITFPAFMARLPDSDTIGKTDYMITLEGLARISVERSISDTLVRRLLNQLDIVLRGHGSPAYAQAILSTLIYVLSQRELSKDSNLSTYHERLTVGLIARAVNGSMNSELRTALNTIETLEILGRLANLIVRALDGHKQASVAQQLYSLFHGGELFAPRMLAENTVVSQRMLIILSTWLMAAIRRDVSPTPVETHQLADCFRYLFHIKILRIALVC